MKTHAILIAILIFLTHPLIAQKSSIDLVFTGDNNGDYAILDSIYIKNLTQSADIMLYAPDTIINLFWTGINEFPADLSSLSLAQNFPNPFNPSTAIRYSLNQTADIKLTIVDVNGRLVTTLRNDQQPAGKHCVYWSGVDDQGNSVSTGVYFCCLAAGGLSQTIKMVYLR